MADEKGTQKPKERVKYKFGQNNIDLTNYIHNLGTNVQSYLNSKNWNEGQKQEFMNSYNRYLAGLQEQLANNTNRFTTDDFGSIIDSTGALSNTDNDNIDPVGSEYYYDNKGNRITSDDFNTLDKRKQKNYNTFSANREVATYFNTIGNALKDMEPPKEKVQDAFDLSKHGFEAEWTKIANPAGGNLDLTPYAEGEEVDENGNKKTTKRASYLKEQLDNYIDNLQDYDFSNSPFKDRDSYLAKLRAASEKLANGYNHEDAIALTQAGIGNEFLSKFFATGAPIQKSELESQAEQAAQKLAEREKEDQLRAVIKAEADDRYNRERDTFFADYAAQNPFQSNINVYTTPSYNPRTVYDQLQRKYNFDSTNQSAIQEAVKTYINFPQLAQIIRGRKRMTDGNGNDITVPHIANNLHFAAYNDLLTDKIGDTGYYVVPNSEDYNNWSYIAYNPKTGHYQEQSMLLNEELKKKMAYAEYDRRHKGIQKQQLGGIVKYVEESRQNKTQEEKQKVEQKSYTTGRTKEQIESDQAPHTEWSNADRLRLGAIAGDISSLIASMTGVGSVASAGIGMASTATNQAADMTEGMGFLESLGNNAVSYGLDAISVLPFAKAAKVPIIVKKIASLTPKIIAGVSAVQGLTNGEEILKSLKKVKDGESLTVGDWKNISQGLQIVLGGGAAFNRARAANKRLDAARTDSEYVQTNQGTVKLSADKMEKLRNATSLKQQNEILKDSGVTLKGKQTGKFWNRKTSDEAVDIPENFVYDLSKPVTLHSGDLQYKYKFGPGEKLLGGVNLDIKFPRVRNAYNKVFHPQASKRKSQSSTPSLTRNQNNFDKLRQLSSQTSKLTPQEIAIINKQRVKSKKGKLTEQEIQALNQRRQNRVSVHVDNSLQARLQKYKNAKREGKFTSVEDDIKRAKDELAEANRNTPEAKQALANQIADQRAAIAVDRNADNVRTQQLRELAAQTLSKQVPPIPKAPLRGIAYTNREKFYNELFSDDKYYPIKVITQPQKLQLVPEIPRKPSKAQHNSRQKLYDKLFGIEPTIPKTTKGLVRAQRKQEAASQKLAQEYIDKAKRLSKEKEINKKINWEQTKRELPHKQSNKKKKTSRDDRRTVRREDGGTLDLVRVRKFQNAGKFPEWYSRLYKFQNLTGWNNQLNQSSAGPSITNSNAGHYRAGDLSEAYTKNNSYTSNPDLVRQDLQSYYDSSFKGKSLDDYVSAYNANAAKIRRYWDQERTYKQSGAQEHNRLFKDMFRNRSDDSNNVWNIGYDSDLEDTVGSSTWLRRMDRYEKEFDKLSDEEKKSRIHKIDLGNGNFGYVYKKANGDIDVWNQPVTSSTFTSPTDSQTTSVISQEYSNDNKQNKPLFGNINPTIAYGLPRAMYADRMNRRITDLAKKSIVPLLKDPFEVHRYTRSDLDAEMQGERNYANLRRLASRPITSDGNLQTATQLQAEVQGQEARTAGKEKSNQVQRQYDELAWQQEKENAASRHEAAMFNRERQWVADQIKNKFEQAYLSQKFNIWDVLGQQLEYDARTKQQEKKALADNFAKFDIHNAISYAPNDYEANLTPNELTVWNKVLSGTNPSSLLPEELNSYKLAAQKVSRAESEQLRQYYKVPNTRWSGKTPSTPWSPTISKAISAKNGAKIAVAGIKAKTADAERFQKQIKECIDRHEKTIDRLSKSLYELIKASMIK